MSYLLRRGINMRVKRFEFIVMISSRGKIITANDEKEAT